MADKAGNQATEVSQSPQQVQEVSVLTQRTKGTDGTSSRYSLKDLKLVLDAVQRIVCLGLAVWVMLHYNNIWEFVALLAISHISPREAKDILVRILKALPL